MSVIAVLNTLVQADTSSFDRGIDRATQTTGKFAEAVRKQSKATDQALGNVGSTFNKVLATINASPLGNIVAPISAVVASARTAIDTLVNVAAAGARAGQVVAHAFERSAATVGAAVFSAVGNVASGIVSGIASTLGQALTVALTVGGAIGAVLSGGFLIAAAAAATFTAGAAGVIAVLSHIGSAGAASMKGIGDLSRTLGMSVTNLSRIASTAGVDTEAFGHAVLHMQRSIEEGGTGAARALDKMNLSLDQLQNMGPSAQLAAIYGAFHNLETQGERASVAMALFGRSGIQMLDSLSRGTEGLQMAAKRAEFYGLTFNAAEENLVRRSLRAWNQISLGWEGISRKLAVIFAPAWEAVGNFGGEIMASIVRVLSDSRITFAVGHLADAVVNTTRSVFDSLVNMGSNILASVFGTETFDTSTASTAILSLLTVTEFTITNIGDLMSQLWAHIKLEAITVANSTLVAFNGIITGLNAAINTAIDGVNRISGYLGVPALSHLQIPMLGDLRDQVAEAAREVEDIDTRMSEAFQELLRSRAVELGQAARDLRGATDAVERAASEASGRLAPGGNAAPLAGSQEAFSILNSRQADLNAVMESHLEITRRIEQHILDELQELRRRPSVAVVAP